MLMIALFPLIMTLLAAYWLLIYTKPVAAPDGCLSPKIVFTGLERFPIIGFWFRLKGIIGTPTVMLEQLHRQFGHFFLVRIPFQQLEITYISSTEAYKEIMKLKPEVARMGPVMKKVPTIGYWFPREKKDEASLQELMLVGKKYMATQLTNSKIVQTYPEIIKKVVMERTSNWNGQQLNIAEALPEVIFHAAGRCVAGAELWEAIGEKVTPLYRKIGNGIDIVRVTLSLGPWHYFMPEYQSTKKLFKILNRVVEENHRTGKYPIISQIRKLEIDKKPIAEKDIPWMLMYVLWNSLTYPGSYIFWTMADILSNAEVLAKAKVTEDPKAHFNFLRDCFMETIRLSPVTSLVRQMPNDLVLEADGQKYFIPKGGYVGVFVQKLARDEEAFDEANSYNPFRYQSGEKVPSLFGMGSFGCIAKQFSIVLATNIISTLIQQFDFELLNELPERRCRVHLTYASQPLVSKIKKIGHLAEIIPISEASAYLSYSQDAIAKCPFHAFFGLKPKNHSHPKRA